MNDYKARIDDFLAQKRIAVVGVSRNEAQTANGIYRKFRENGYEVFPINPNAATVEGDLCYATVKDVPGGVDEVMIVTSPDITEQVVQDCIQAGAPESGCTTTPCFHPVHPKPPLLPVRSTASR
jgi:predicted CoA-binding protein